MHEQYYTKLEATLLIQENMVELEDPSEYSYVVQEINAWGWGILKTPTEVVNLDNVQEFYENAKPTKDSPSTRLFWVWGRIVPLDRDVIHAYIKDNYVANLDQLDQFIKHQARGNWNYNRITIDICEAGKTYEVGQDGLPPISKDLT